MPSDAEALLLYSPRLRAWCEAKKAATDAHSEWLRATLIQSDRLFSVYRGAIDAQNHAMYSLVGIERMIAHLLEKSDDVDFGKAVQVLTPPAEEADRD